MTNFENLDRIELFQIKCEPSSLFRVRGDSRNTVVCIDLVLSQTSRKFIQSTAAQVRAGEGVLGRAGQEPSAAQSARIGL